MQLPKLVRAVKRLRRSLSLGLVSALLLIFAGQVEASPPPVPEQTRPAADQPAPGGGFERKPTREAAPSPSADHDDDWITISEPTNFGLFAMGIFGLLIGRWASRRRRERAVEGSGGEG